MINAKMLSMFGLAGSMFGVGLMDIIKENPNLRVLSSDMSTPAGLDKFKQTYPDNFVNVGIAEQNMIGIAAGLTDEGFRTVSVAQACFITMRSFEQIRQFCGYMHSNQIIVGIGAGLSLQLMGNTHYSIEDIALMKTIPSMKIIVPCDALEAVKAFEKAITMDSPVYIRLYAGTGSSVVYNEDIDFEIGKAIKLKEGNDIQIIATGNMVNVALQVSKQLEEDNIKASVIDMHTIKPLDTSVIDFEAKTIVTIEEHSIIGGLGDSISSYLTTKNTHPRLLKIGLNDCYSPVVGDYKYMLEENSLSAEKIIQTIKNNL